MALTECKSSVLQEWDPFPPPPLSQSQEVTWSRASLQHPVVVAKSRSSISRLTANCAIKSSATNTSSRPTWRTNTVSTVILRHHSLELQGLKVAPCQWVTQLRDIPDLWQLLLSAYLDPSWRCQPKPERKAETAPPPCLQEYCPRHRSLLPESRPERALKGLEDHGLSQTTS